MQELLIYGAPALTFGLGYFIAKRGVGGSDTLRDPVNILTDSALYQFQRQKYLAATKANQELSNSNQRLTDALQAKNERLERIVEAFEGQQSGTAQKAVKIARGDA